MGIFLRLQPRTLPILDAMTQEPNRAMQRTATRFATTFSHD